MMSKIKTTSHFLYLFFRFLCFFLPVITVYLVLFNLEVALNIGIWAGMISPDQIQNVSTFSFVHRLTLLVIELLPLSVTIYILHKLSNLFHLYEQGYLFEEENIKLIKHIGIGMVAGQFIHVFYQPMMTTAFTFNNAAGDRFASLSIGTTNMSTLITGFIIIVASWIVKEAQQLKSEVQLTI